jgi:DNA-binding XRE family transcriptional regulator
MNVNSILTVEVPTRVKSTVVSLVRHLGGMVIDSNNHNNSKFFSESELFDDDNVIVSEPIPNEKKVGTIIRGLRIREGLTQKQLAEIVGESQAHISEYENNIRQIPRRKRTAFAKALNTVASNFSVP